MNVPAGPAQHFADIQWLRGAAALLVVFEHLKNEVMFRLQGLDPVLNYAPVFPFAAGVDIFFVISGFVIAHSSTGLFGRPGAWRVFLARRLARIVPLYWLLSAGFLVLLALAGSRLLNGADPLFLLGSFLFVPVANADGAPLPILPLGWTLNYEMMFYVVFALVIGVKRRFALPLIAAILLVIVAAGQVLRPTSLQLLFWSDPIILEFLAGIAIHAAVARGLTLPGLARLMLVAAGVAILYGVGIPVDLRAERWIVWGGPAAMIVLAAATGGAGRRQPLAELAGDTSYAVYLAHLFVLIALARAFVAVGWTGWTMSFVVYPLVALALVALGSYLLNRLFERPVLRFLRRRIDAR